MQFEHDEALPQDLQELNEQRAQRLACAMDKALEFHESMIKIQTNAGMTQEEREQVIEDVPYDEGMTLYREIKQRYHALFHELANQ